MVNMVNTVVSKVKDFMNKKNNKTIATIGLIVVCFFAFNLGGLLSKVFTSITSIFSSDGEVKQVIFKSDGYDTEEDGSFKVTKQADWTSTSTAQINFTVDSIMEADIVKKDIIVVLDTSSSMKGSRIISISNNLKNLFSTILEDQENKFALITFNDTATIQTDFTNNVTTLNNLLDNITPTGETNYNQALLRVGDIMSDYTKSDDREVKVIFITDGLPNVEHPNQNATYEQLKDKYPYVEIHAIPTSMGYNVNVPEIYRVSDYQYYSYLSLDKLLLQIAYSPVGYETFEIADYIDSTYFEVESSNDIEVSIGSATLTTENGIQKITWTVPSGTFKTGSSHTLKINLKLKDTYVKQEGLYSTNTQTNISIKLPEKDMIEMTTTETAKLKAPYKITYEANAPTGCNASISLTEKHYAYETVNFTNQTLECDGYQFVGWEVELKEKTMVNSEAFIMPTQDITVKGVWTKLTISKNMSGEVYEKLTLYDSIARQAIPDNVTSKYVTSVTGVNFGAISSDINGKGVYTIASTANNEYPIHYFRGDIENNHVIFGGFCWEIVRTTETGGVKLIYDGKPSNGKCSNTGTSSQIGTSPFNILWNSPAASGYMYNKIYYHRLRGSAITQNVLTNNTSMSGTSYYYGTSATYNSSTGTYTLGSAVTRAWNSYYSNLTGYYTCLSTATSCSTVYYVLEGYSTYAYLLPLNSGKTITTETMSLGTGLTENSNGTYTLTGTTTIKKIDWFANFANYQGYYVCSNYSSTNCSTAYYIHSPSNYQIVVNTTDHNYLYGNSFTYDTTTGTYKLNNTISFWKQYTDYNKIGNYHYTCLNKTGTCTSLHYVFTSIENNVLSLLLTGGKSIGEALNEMLWNDDVNEIDSTVKTYIDEWYEKNMINYTTYLEDTVWCNDRELNSLGAWDPNSGEYIGELNFKPVFRIVNATPSLKCTNSIDQFTVSSSKGNGELSYPIGLITSDEVTYAGASSRIKNGTYYLYTGTNYWTMSAIAYDTDNDGAIGGNVYMDGSLFNRHIGNEFGVRPMVSLKPGITYTSGNGTEDNPYVIDLSS